MLLAVVSCPAKRKMKQLPRISAVERVGDWVVLELGEERVDSSFAFIIGPGIVSC